MNVHKFYRRILALPIRLPGRSVPMNHPTYFQTRGVSRGLSAVLTSSWLLSSGGHAHGSFLHGDTLDTVANVFAWAALVIAPIVLIAVFLMVHILPEKIAHKKGHPQTAAIQCLCLLSLVFGGLLWPLAWLWAYTKPVGYKLAYGTDRVDPPDAGGDTPAASELERLRARIAELEAQSDGRDA